MHPHPIEQFRPLQDYLERFYPAGHEVSLVTTRTHPLTRSTIRHFKLSDLATELVQAPPVATLYIAPVVERAIEDTALLEVMQMAGAEPAAVHDAVTGGTPA
jgi:hypothetical protein